MAHYMGPTAGVSKILEKLLVIFSTVTSFDILMQNFYKISQGGNEKVPSFVTRLEGTLNQIRIKCPGRIADHEVPGHLEDLLFHGVKKHVRDSIRYLYSNTQTTYSKLVAVRRAESETEETKVKARSAAATEVPSGSKELGYQIARLMATLTRAEQSSHSASAPTSPRHRGHGRGRTDRNTSVCPNSQNGWTGLGQTSACSSSIVNKTSAESPHRGNQNMQTSVQGGTQGAQSSSSLQCFRCQGWDHMARECTTPAMQLNREGGPKGMQSNLPPIMCSKFKTFPL